MNSTNSKIAAGLLVGAIGVYLAVSLISYRFTYPCLTSTERAMPRQTWEALTFNRKHDYCANRALEQ